MTNDHDPKQVPKRGKFWLLHDYSELDRQIDKFRQLAEDYKKSNRAYYGEYLSRILFEE
jgi:hypothetical protein